MSLDRYFPNLRASIYRWQAYLTVLSVVVPPKRGADDQRSATVRKRHRRKTLNRSFALWGNGSAASFSRRDGCAIVVVGGWRRRDAFASRFCIQV